MPTQTYHHGDLKTELIREGLKLLDAKGYDGFSMRQVATLCGVSQTAPYRHFHNKDELIAAITDHALNSFSERLQSAVDRYPGDPKAQLTEMGVGYVRFFAENPEYMRLLFLSDAKLKTRFTRASECRQHPSSFGILSDTAARLVEAYPQLPYSHEEMIVYSWGLVHGIATLIAAGELPNDEATLACAEKVIRGLY